MTEWVWDWICKGIIYKAANMLQWASAEPDRIKAFKDKAVLKKEVDKICERRVVSS